MTLAEFEELLADIPADTMAALLNRAAILTAVEAKRAEVARAQEARQAVIDAQDAGLRVLNTELAELVAQANASL